MMRAACVAIWRICLPAWVGIACYFLTSIVSLRGSELFAVEVKLNHPKVLFPLYYQFEFALLALATLSGLGARTHSQATGTAWTLGRRLVLVALGLAIADYVWIYRPLAAMLAAPSLAENFATYHHASRWINAIVVGLCAIASMLTAWPGSKTAIPPSALS